MPSQTFLNLPSKKQGKLIDAAITEFSRVPFSMASINQIIKNAGISRGSFYTYFNSKEDIFDYILALFQSEIKKRLKNTLKVFNGDIFVLFEKIYDVIIEKVVEGPYSDFFKNALKHFRFYVDDEKKDNPNRFKWKNTLTDLHPYINRENLNCENDEDFSLALSMLVAITMFSVNVTVHGKLNKEEGKRLYKKRLELIKKGLLKKEGGIK